MKTFYQAAILGQSGYVGKELIMLIQKHPDLQLLPLNTIEDCLKNEKQLDVVFLATPPEASMKAATALIHTPIPLIDISGAFRLPKEDFQKWYAMEHSASDLIAKACYGLTPFAKEQSACSLIANPGCYASSALMALLPLYQEHLIESTDIIIDAKSGVSGAGKKVSQELLFAEIAGNFLPYKIGKHQHIPEIEKAIYDFSSVKTKVTLTTSLLPTVRGIAMSIYLKAASSLPSDKAIAEAIHHAFEKAYQNYPFVFYQEVGMNDAERDTAILALKSVLHTPYCHIGFFIHRRNIILFSCIDNLGKGAASQAIENFNALYQLPLQRGFLL